jgi:hypothetical protein
MHPKEKCHSFLENNDTYCHFRGWCHLRGVILPPLSTSVHHIFTSNSEVNSCLSALTLISVTKPTKVTITIPHYCSKISGSELQVVVVKLTVNLKSTSVIRLKM